MNNDLPRLVVIGGPTCSGKSTLAVELALTVGGEIINADSMQVYRDMDIGTAKLPLVERRGIPHHLIDIVNPDQDFNAALFLSHALPIVQNLHDKEIPVIVVGGTGLYVKALLGGLFKAPPSDPELRRNLLEECKSKGLPFVYQKLSNLDWKAAQNIHPKDRIRIIRALEVIQLTGSPFSELTRRHSFSERRFLSLNLCLELDREILYKRINARAVSMIDSGLIGELETLLDMGYSPELKPMQAIGYRHVLGYRNGAWDLNETIRLIQRDTRRYAKRQLTWFRADPTVTWVNPDDRQRIFNRVTAFYAKA